MIGRDDVLDRVGRLLDRARAEGRGGCLLITGEAGVGKSTILDHVADTAEGFRLLRVDGVQSESEADHGGLHQLMAALTTHVAGIPERQRRALESVLGWGPSGDPSERPLLGPAVLSVLAAVAASDPTIVLVDDVHWLDVASATPLTFAARRLASDPVVVLMASRPEGPVGTADSGIDTMTIGGFTAAEAAGVLPSGTSDAVVRTLTRMTGGNPLGLVETAARLTAAQLRGASALPHPLPVGDRLETIYGPHLETLSPDGRFAVVLLAASREASSTAVIGALAERLGSAEVVLAEVEEAGLITRESTGLRFRHELVRSAVWNGATHGERRDAHLALAAATPDDERLVVWHLAEAATEPDDELAHELERFAALDRERMGYGAASAWLERSSQLSVDGTARADRLADAIETASTAGDIERSRSLATRLLEGDAHAEARGRALAVLGSIEQSTGSIPRASQLLRRAADATTGVRKVRVLAELGLVYQRLGDYGQLADVARRLDDTADRSDAEQRFLRGALAGLVALVGGHFDVAGTTLEEAFDTFHGEPSVRDDPRHLPLATLMVAAVELTPERSRFLEDRLANARALGALTVLVPVLAMFSYGRASLLGDHLGAFADAGEAADLGRELGLVVDRAPAVEMVAWQSAARGAHDRADQLLAQAADLTERAGTIDVAAHLALTRAFCALCRDDLGAVIAILEPRLAMDGGRGSMGELLGVAPALIEAYAAVGRDEDARVLTADLVELAAPDALSRALTARCEALVADAAEAAGHFERALAAHTESPDVFERARTELLFGSHLRHVNRRTEARVELRRALARFDAMDHSVWTQRCIAELAASGESARHRRSTGHEPLTPQETRVALLVGQGMTNREVAAALFVSPKTIETHLGSVYRKRNLRSRSELARALAAGELPA